MFVVFEGVDGAGKSEVSKIVAEKLGAIHLESPTTPFSSIRNHVDKKLSDKGRFYFYMASNFDLSEKILTTLRSKSIVCARYFHSTVIGYASRQNIDIESVYKSINVTREDLINPHLTIFLNVNEDTQRKRINGRGLSENSQSDYKCLENERYRERLFRNYKYISEKEGWHIIDTSAMSISEVANECISVINNYKKIIDNEEI